MGRQRNMSHVKEQNEAPEKELDKMKTNSLPDAEFKTLVMRMLSNLGEEQMNSVRTLTKKWKTKKNRSEVTNTVTEMKNTLEGINSRLVEVVDLISDLEYKVAENRIRTAKRK